LRERIKIKAKQTTNKNTNKTKTVKEIFEIFANWQSLYRHTLHTQALSHTHTTPTQNTHINTHSHTHRHVRKTRSKIYYKYNIYIL